MANEPGQLTNLMTLYHVLRTMDAGLYCYHTLAEFEAHYDAGDWDTDNYLWYHGRLFTTAEEAYQAAAVEAVRQMWEAFVAEDVRDVSDTEPFNLLYSSTARAREDDHGLATVTINSAGERHYLRNGSRRSGVTTGHRWDL